MFSGLTNQVSSWMGAAKGEPQDEQVPTPTQDADAGADVSAQPEAEKTQSPTKPGSKLDLINNVKSQMTGWLGSGIPIPGLRKSSDAPADTAEAPAATESAPEAPKDGKDDDDNSSATGGADSRPASGPGTPTEDPSQPAGNDRKVYNLEAIEVPDFRELTTKAVAGAKYIGSFLSSAVNKAGAKVSEASAKIKKTVEENSILGELNKEQDAFIKGQEAKGRSGAAVPPWVGAHNEAALKEECLSLSTDRRNFVRAPPAGVEFAFDYDAMYPVATAIMAEDTNLEKMRFDLVPKVITEENFWRNYFYRLSLICQANEADAADATQRQSSADDSQDVEARTEKGEKNANEKLIKSERGESDSIEDVKKRIKSLRVDEENDDEQWEAELDAELLEYESGAGQENQTEKQWEKECDVLLEDDLK